MRIALLGTRGVPPRYGGFETAVDEIGSRLAARGHSVTVYCRNPGQTLTEYRGMHLVNLPALRTKTTETLSHTGASVAHLVHHAPRPEAAFVFNAANAPYIKPLQRAGVPVAVHLDGLESKRAKWRGLGSRYFSWAERASIRWADAVVADSSDIAAYIERVYGRSAEYIPYGAPVIEPASDRLHEVGLSPNNYALAVARFEPENQLLEIARAYHASSAPWPLALVGDSPYSRDYVDAVTEVASRDARISILGSIYDQDLLDQIYGGCHLYVHGHSVGGTNPSLLRALGAGAPVLSYDVAFNREVTGGHAAFWNAPTQLAALLNSIDTSTEQWIERRRAARDHVAEHYQWDSVATRYETLAGQLKGLRRG
jgi:glycosyltransferase involved in cell wall biosynthesis